MSGCGRSPRRRRRGRLMRIAVVGARGSSARRSCTSSPARTRSIGVRRARARHQPTTRRSRRRWRGVRPDVIVNCAAYNDVDGAEDHPVEALNAQRVRRAGAGARRGRRTARRWCTTAPTSCSTATRHGAVHRNRSARIRGASYAASKLLGEWFAADAPRAYVLRVESLFGQRRGRRAAEGQRRGDREDAAGRRGSARVRGSDGVADLRHRRRARDAAARRDEAPAGLYHCVNSGHCTWLEFARELARAARRRAAARRCGWPT